MSGAGSGARSSMVPHASQEGHRPAHRLRACPQALQARCVLTLATADEPYRPVLTRPPRDHASDAGLTLRASALRRRSGPLTGRWKEQESTQGHQRGRQERPPEPEPLGHEPQEHGAQAE
jgi:hypothetical protein